MSIPYIEMRCNLWTNPKVQRMAKEAKAPIASIIGGLHWFWSQVHEHGECDRVASLTADMVDKAVRVKGFAKAAETAGWIVFDSDGAQAPRWEESSTANAKERQRLYEAKRKLRWRKQLSEAGIEECPQNVPDKSGTSPGQVRDCPRQTELNRAELNKTEQNKTTSAFPVGFVEFWNEYPAGSRRKNRPAALKSWIKNRCEGDIKNVLSGLRDWKRDWEKKENQFVPLVTTFLNGRDWETPPPGDKKKFTAEVIDELMGWGEFDPAMIAKKKPQPENNVVADIFASIPRPPNQPPEPEVSS